MGPAVKVPLLYANPREVPCLWFSDWPQAGTGAEGLKGNVKGWSCAGQHIRVFGVAKPRESITTWDGQTVALHFSSFPTLT